MSQIRLYNARIADFSAETPRLIEGELWTRNEQIAYAGAAREDAGTMRFDREIDCRGNVLLPGFKNAHSHAAMVFLRSLADDLPLQRWLTEQVFPFEDLLTPDDIRVLVRLGCMEMLTSGITAMFDMYFFREAAAEAAVDVGMRTVFCNVGGPAEKAAAEYERFNHYHPLISDCMGTHGKRRFACTCTRLRPRSRAVSSVMACGLLNCWNGRARSITAERATTLSIWTSAIWRS